MKKLIAALLALAFALPAAVSAQSTTDLQAQAQSLLQQVAQLQAQLAAQGGASTNTGVSATTGASVGASASCPNIGRVLKLGSTGDDVTRLQQFLAADPSVYPQGTVSGYFGSLTQTAVQRWQAKYNVVSSGSPSTTGYGVVGPRTAAAIALLCSTGASSPVGGYIQVTPISGNAPLNVNVNATVNSTNSCVGGLYQLSWGDGTNPISIQVAPNNCQPMTQTYQHSYTIGGTYQILLSSGAHQTSATVTVYGNAPQTSTTGSTNGTTQTVQQETFTATPVSGTSPLAVTFSGIVTGADLGWCANGCTDILALGDGTQAAVPLPSSQTQAQTYSLQHTYTHAGTYSAILYQGQAGNGRPIVGSPISIQVVNANGSTGTTTSSLNPPSVTPAFGGNPMAVQIQFDLVCGGSFTINWGDSTTPTSSAMGCGGGITTTTGTQNHTYAAAGNYTITLTRGSRTDTAAVNISN